MSTLVLKGSTLKKTRKVSPKLSAVRQAQLDRIHDDVLEIRRIRGLAHGDRLPLQLQGNPDVRAVEKPSD